MTADGRRTRLLRAAALRGATADRLLARGSEVRASATTR